MPFVGKPDQLWIFIGNRITNRARPQECISDKKGEKPCHAKPYKGKSTQHWRAEYVM